MSISRKEKKGRNRKGEDRGSGDMRTETEMISWNIPILRTLEQMIAINAIIIIIIIIIPWLVWLSGFDRALKS